MKEPKDLGIKIGTPEEVFWTDIKKKSEEAILSCEREMIIQSRLIELAIEIIDIEQQKMKE